MEGVSNETYIKTLLVLMVTMLLVLSIQLHFD